MIARNKKVLSFLVLMSMLLSMGFTINAQPLGKVVVDNPVLQWVNTSSMTVSLSFAGSKGTLSAVVTGEPTVSSITGIAVIERKNTDGSYTEVASWSDLSEKGNLLMFGQTYYVAKGYTYRFTFTTTVYKNGIGETISSSKSAVAE